MKKICILFIMFTLMTVNVKCENVSSNENHQIQILNEYGYPMKNTEISIILDETTSYYFKCNSKGFIFINDDINKIFDGKEIVIRGKSLEKNLLAVISYNNSVENVVLGEIVNDKSRIIPDWTTISRVNLGKKKMTINQMPVRKGLQAEFVASDTASYSFSGNALFLGGSVNKYFSTEMSVLQDIAKDNPDKGYMNIYTHMNFYQEVQMSPNGQKRTVVFTDYKFDHISPSVVSSNYYSSGKYMNLQFTKASTPGSYRAYSQGKDYTIVNTIPGICSFNITAGASKGYTKRYYLVDKSKKYSYKIYEDSIVRQ